MLTRTPAAANLSPDDFLAKFMTTPAGRQLVEEKESERVAARRQAVAVIAADPAVDDEIRALGTALDKAQRKVRDLAAQMIAAQQHHGALNRERTFLETRRQNARRKARAFLEDGAPPEVQRFCVFAKTVLSGARFTMTQRRVRNDGHQISGPSNEEFAEASVLEARAAAVLRAAQALKYKPDVTVDDIALLERELDAPRKYYVA